MQFKHIRPRILPIVVFAVILASPAAGQSTWNGSVSSNWGLAGNWTGGVPNSNTDVIIPAGTPNSPSTSGVATPVCRDLTVNPAATLAAPSGFRVDCARTVTVDGTVTGTGGLRLVGAANASLGGSGTIAVVEVAKTAGTQLPIAGNVTAGSFTLTSGSFMASAGSATFTVTGNASFQGGVFSVASFTGTVIVGGSVTFAGTNATGQLPPMFCGGNWTADANFAPGPGSGVVTFNGTGAQTISGPGIFAGLTVAAGSITSASNLTVNGNLTANGSLAVSGVLDGNGDVTVGAAGALNVGGGTDTVAGSLTVDGTLTSTGTLVLDGTTGSANLSSASPLPSLQVARGAGTQITAFGATASSVTLTSGSLQVSSGGLTVTGSALFQGGTFSVGSFTGTVFVGGNVTFSGTDATGQVPPIHCGGNWTADANFAPNVNSGAVILDGTGAQTISGAGVFKDLTVAAGSIASGASVTVNGNLNVDGSLTVSSTLDVNGNVTVGATGTLNAGGGTITIAGSLTVTGNFGATGTVLLDGTSSASISSASSLPNLQIARGPGSQLTLAGNVTASSLTLTSGTFQVSVGVLTVTGNALFQGGTLSIGSFTGSVVVGGNVTFAGTNATGQLPPISCGGNWTADANFAPTSGFGAVTLNKTGAQTISGPGIFNALTVSAGSITSGSNLTVNGNLSANGSLAVSGVLDANGDVTVGVAGALDVGGGTDTFAGSLVATGPFTSTGTVVLDGGIAGNLASASPLPNVQVAKTPGIQLTLGGNVTASSFTLTSGTFAASASTGQTLTVTGNALFQGGALLLASFAGVIDVGGNVTFAGTSAASNIPTIRCAGNWSADAGFAPTGGTVELDGASPTTIAHGTPGGTLGFADLVIKNGSRTMVNDFTVAVQTMTIDSTGSLTVGSGRHLRLNQAAPTAASVNGGLTIAANAELSMGPQTAMTVGATGSLTLVGTAAQPAKITGEAGGGYALTVDGTLAAKDFVLKEMGQGGFVIGFPATIAAAPNDFRNGTLDVRAGAPAGSVLLDVRRSSPAVLDQIVFLNTPAVAGVFNVKTDPASLPVSLTNWTGPFAGPAFENDPNNLITWNVQPPPGVASFAVIPGAELAEIVWHMSNETNVVSYDLRKSSSAAGPFPIFHSVAAFGAHYGFIDQPLAANQQEFYLLYANMNGGEAVLIGSGSTTPYSSNPPPNVYKVGGNGAFATIQDAINAAVAPSSVVWVTPGTYAAFSIGATAPPNLHVIAEEGPNQVVIDTSSGPIQISNVPASSGIELSNLVVGSATTAQNAVVVSNCACAVVLDALTVSCDGAHTAIQVSACPSTAIQRSAISGGTGLSVTAASHVAISRGSLSSLVSTNSTIEMTSLTPGSTSVIPASSLVARSGVMPDVNLPELCKLSFPSALFLDAFPNAPFIIMASPRLGFATVNPFEMPVLLDFIGMVQLPINFTDAFGQGVVGFEISPNASLLGFTFVVQVGAFDGSNWRFSNVETMVAVP